MIKPAATSCALMGELYRLTYVSNSSIEYRDGMQLTQLFNILLSSRRNNARLDVTGALHLQDDVFTQVLEGPSASVETVFEKIGCDTRHRDISVFSFRQVEFRIFSKWRMAFARLPFPKTPEHSAFLGVDELNRQSAIKTDEGVVERLKVLISADRFMS